MKTSSYFLEIENTTRRRRVEEFASLESYLNFDSGLVNATIRDVQWHVKGPKGKPLKWNCESRSYCVASMRKWKCFTTKD